MVYKVPNAPLALSVFRYCEFANFFFEFPNQESSQIQLQQSQTMGILK